jgi:hypothetical protein
MGPPAQIAKGLRSGGGVSTYQIADLALMQWCLEARRLNVALQWRKLMKTCGTKVSVLLILVIMMPDGHCEWRLYSPLHGDRVV